MAQAVNQAMILGSADILLTELLAPHQANILAQVAVCRAPMTLDDLAFTFSPGLDSPSKGSTPSADSPQGLPELRADTARLADLTLLAPGQDITMHPWTAALVTRKVPGDPTALHQRALDMRWRRFGQQRGRYDDLLDIPATWPRFTATTTSPDVAEQAAQVLSGTLATVAYLAEIRPLIPPAERAWILVADLEVQALLSAGNLPAATRQLEAIHQQVETRAAADPANTEWQRDLSVSREKLGNVTAAAGDLDTARGHYQASLDIRVKLAAADPANTQKQSDLSLIRQRIADLGSSDPDG